MLLQSTAQHQASGRTHEYILSHCIHLYPMGSRAAEPPSAVAPAVEQQAAAGSEEYVNLGLQTWLERRQQWIRRTADQKQQHRSRKRTYSPQVTPEQVLSFAPFPKPVPLEDVIEVLTEVWEQEDFYA